MNKNVFKTSMPHFFEKKKKYFINMYIYIYIFFFYGAGGLGKWLPAGISVTHLLGSQEVCRNPRAFTVMTGESFKKIQRQVLTVIVGAHEVANQVLAEKNMTQMCEGFVPKFESP